MGQWSGGSSRDHCLEGHLSNTFGRRPAPTDLPSELLKPGKQRQRRGHVCTNQLPIAPLGGHGRGAANSHELTQTAVTASPNAKSLRQDRLTVHPTFPLLLLPPPHPPPPSLSSARR